MNNNINGSFSHAMKQYTNLIAVRQLSIFRQLTPPYEYMSTPCYTVKLGATHSNIPIAQSTYSCKICIIDQFNPLPTIVLFMESSAKILVLI